MHRTRRRVGVVGLAVAVALLFIPLAAASNADRATQTLTLLALVGALAGLGLAWLALRPRGNARTLYLGIAALSGALATWALVPVIHDFDAADYGLLLSRFFLVAAIDAAGLWVFVLALRRVFVGRRRGYAVAAIALVAVGLLPAPTLLVQPGVTALNILEVRQQLQAGSLYWTTGFLLLVAPFLALTTVPGTWFEDWWGSAARWAMSISDRRFAAGLVLVTLGLALFITWYAFGGRPTTADEIAQLWHARMLLGGRLSLPPDPNPEFFAIDNVIDRPHWMSQFPIGGPAVLAVGLAAHAVWALNPLLTAFTARNVYRFAQRAYDEPQARVAAAVFATSPMILIMGATQMNHTPTAWLVTSALAALPVWARATERAHRMRSAALIGVAIGAATAIRPLDGVLAGVVFGMLMLALASRDRSRGSSLLVALGAGAIPVALLLAANWATTGNAFRFGYEVLWGANHSLGLHDDPTGHPHTAWRALLLGVKYAAQLNWIATAWPAPVLLLVAWGLLLARRMARWDAVLFGLFGAQLVVYSFYWHDGQFVGPRFMFTAVPGLLLLTARAPFVASPRLRGAARRMALIVIPVCIGVTWLRHMPPFGMQGLVSEFHASRSRLKLDPPREIQRGVVQNALVFVQEGAATRLLHRLWGVGVSRPAAARLLETADACTLLEATRAEERRAPPDTSGQLARMTASVRPFRQGAGNVQAPDPNFRITDAAGLTPACRAEIALDLRLKNTVAYGAVLPFNQFDRDGRIAGSAVYVMNLGERNTVLRARFADRHWFRYELPRSRPDTLPVLVPYESLP